MIGVIERFVCYVFLRCCEKNHSDSEIGNYDAFGIAVFRITDGAKEQLCHIEDVFLNENKAREFTREMQ